MWDRVRNLSLPKSGKQKFACYFVFGGLALGQWKKGFMAWESDTENFYVKLLSLLDTCRILGSQQKLLKSCIMHMARKMSHTS